MPCGHTAGSTEQQIRRLEDCLHNAPIDGPGASSSGLLGEARTWKQDRISPLAKSRPAQGMQRSHGRLGLGHFFRQEVMTDA